MPKTVICIVGPTGGGKSALALNLARQLGGSIINADSRQVYADFPIITAQPSQEEQGLCSHALYGFLASNQAISAGVWSGLALQLLQTVDNPILVGGTGLYFKALLDGMVDIPAVPPELNDRLLQEYLQDPEGLHLRLQHLDAAYAKLIHPHDKQRIIRALAVYEFTGKNFSWWHAQTPPPPDFAVTRLGIKLSLAELEPLLAKRIDLMLSQGAVAEAEAAYAKYPEATAPAWSGIGCRELYAYVSGQWSLAEAKENWLKKTRSYAKRQLTWFNADARIEWQ